MANCLAVWDRIVPLEEVDESAIRGFSCGDAAMDRWFVDLSARSVRTGMSQVSCAMKGGEIVGFFALANHVVEPKELPCGLRSGKNSYVHPCTLLARLAVSEDWQCSQEHVGTALLYHAMKYALDASKLVGSRFIILDPKEGRVDWYARRGFRRLGNGEMVMGFSQVREILDGLGEGFLVI